MWGKWKEGEGALVVGVEWEGEGEEEEEDEEREELLGRERERGGGCLYGSFKRENFNLPHGNHEFPETIPQPLGENNSAT